MKVDQRQRSDFKRIWVSDFSYWVYSMRTSHLWIVKSQRADKEFIDFTRTRFETHREVSWKQQSSIRKTEYHKKRNWARNQISCLRTISWHKSNFSNFELQIQSFSSDQVRRSFFFEDDDERFEMNQETCEAENRLIWWMSNSVWWYVIVADTDAAHFSTVWCKKLSRINKSYESCSSLSESWEKHHRLNQNINLLQFDCFFDAQLSQYQDTLQSDNWILSTARDMINDLEETKHSHRDAEHFRTQTHEDVFSRSSQWENATALMLLASSHQQSELEIYSSEIKSNSLTDQTFFTTEIKVQELMNLDMSKWALTTIKIIQSCVDRFRFIYIYKTFHHRNEIIIRKDSIL